MFFTADKYYKLILRDIGFGHLKDFQERSLSNECKHLISFCEKTFNIIHEYKDRAFTGA
jgi:hypothetical protein